MSTQRHAGASRGQPDPSRAARRQRDASLQRSRTITKGIAYGSVAAVAAAGVYLSQALPGHAATPVTGSGTTGTVSPTSGSVGASSTAPTSSGTSDGTSDTSPVSGIPTPAAAPTPTTRPAPVVSGSS